MLCKSIVRLKLFVVLCACVVIAGCGGSSKRETTIEQRQDQMDQQQVHMSAAQEQTDIEHMEEVVEKPAPAEEPEQMETEQAASGVVIALKFEPGDVTDYQLITEGVKSVLWEGPEGSKPAGFNGGHTGTDITMFFKQRVESTNDQGNGILRITINQMKYRSRVKDNVVLEFDSATSVDADSPFASLIGQSYTIEITPAGQVIRILDAAEARAAVKGSSPAAQAARTLLSNDVIRERHTIGALPTKQANQFQQGEKWSINKSFDFGMMGHKEYEKVYELKAVKQTDGTRVAVAEMEAVPSAAQAQQMHQQQSSSAFTRMFDNTQSFSGRLELGLESGTVLEYVEDLQNEWLAVDPSFSGDAQNQPNALRMSARRLIHLQKID